MGIYLYNPLMGDNHLTKGTTTCCILQVFSPLICKEYLSQVNTPKSFIFNRPYGNLWFVLPETGNELPAYWRLPLRGIESHSECFFVFLVIFSLDVIALSFYSSDSFGLGISI